MSSGEGTAPDIWNERLQQALERHRAGDLDVAEATYAAALRDDPANVDALQLMGALRYAQGRAIEALLLLTRAIQRRPGFAAGHASRGRIILGGGHPDAALLDLDRAIRLQPDYPDALVWRAMALETLNRRAEAENCLTQALTLAPAHPEGLAMRARGIGTGEDPSRVASSLAIAFAQRGSILLTSGAVDAAMLDYDRALRLDPDLPQAHFDRGLALLVRGDLAAGWQGYEWRWLALQKPTPAEMRGRAEWTGGADWRGRRLLLAAEQGLGDTVQFLRYVGMVAARAAQVIVLVQPPVLRLAAGLGGVEIRADEPPADSYDAVCALMSLPALFGTTLASVPAEVPYLRAPAALIAAWRARLGPRRGFRLGLAWAGNPEAMMTALRDVELDAVLAAIPDGVEIISLQRDITDFTRRRLAADPRVRHVGDGLTDLADTSAVIEQLDLVVSVDTVVAHVAGAAARPVWIMLPFSPDWRWMLDRSDSPWYPTARLFRQSRSEDWSGVFAEIGAGLGRLLAGSGQ